LRLYTIPIVRNLKKQEVNMKNIKLLILATLFSFVFSGCVAVAPVVVAAGAGAGGVYSVTTDSIEDNFNMSKDLAFETMIEIIKAENGIITKSSIYDGKIEGELISSKLFIEIKAVNDKQVKVKIEARKGMNLLPDKETAVRVHRLFLKESGQ